ncbi:MAG: SulP family inorganic anion transporter [Devosiaceae bacterium]|nr:SulP family inorganic anion transporter [Devosiaceae bacterium]
MFSRLISASSEGFSVPSIGQLRIDLLSGLTVALALVPEAVAFSFVAGVHPLVGLYAAFIVGIITALIGGRPGMISGATGALAVVMVSLVAQHGVEYLFATVVLMGLIQLFVGIMQWGKFIRLVPHPVMLGFVNGLAIVIFLAQLSQFQVPGTDTGGGGHGMAGGEWLTGIPLYLMLGLTLLTMVIMQFTPKAVSKIIPTPLLAILIVSAIVIGFNLDVRTVGDMASIQGGLPGFHIPMVPLTWQTLEIIAPYAIILAAIGLIESLLTLNLVAEMTDTRGGASKECLAQGTANIVTGFFGGMGGCAMIGQSMINVKSGGRTRWAAISASLFLLAFIVFASGLIEQIPLAALVGVMFMVVVGTFVWRSIRIMSKVPFSDSLVILLVTIVTVWTDLATAVVVGVIISALVYSWNASTRMRATTDINPENKDEKIYRLYGPLFFGSVESFGELFDPKTDPKTVIIDFLESRVVDHSGLQAIDALAEKYQRQGTSLKLRHLSKDCQKLLNKAGQLVEPDSADPNYGVAVDYTIRHGQLRTGH